MRGQLSALAAAAVVSVAGCAVVEDAPQTPVAGGGGIVRLALRKPVSELEAGSAGDPAQAMALSLLYRHGLMDLPKDEVRADALRRQAAQASSPTVLTQYIPGVNGAPGRVVPLILPNARAGAMTSAALCARALDRDPALIVEADGFQQMNPAAIEACGDPEAFGPLVRAWTEARTWRPHPLPDCPPDDDRCAVLSRKVARLNARDPAAEARAAAARGDHRLGGYNHFGPMPQGWRLPGVSCRAWSREMIGSWHVNQDVIRPGDDAHSQAAIAFIAAWNRAMVGSETFPWPDVCKPGIGTSTKPWTGPVTTWPEYARAGNAAAGAPEGADVNQTDLFGRTAFEWAGEADNAPMMIRLLAAGADPNRVADHRDPTPLALALSRRQFDLAEALLARGAKMTGETRLCDSPIFVAPDDPGQGGVCTWVGLLTDRGRPEWIERAVADGASGLWDAYFKAIETRNEPLARRLAPLMGGPHAAGALQKTWKLNRPDLALAMVAHGADGVARSAAEQRVWKAAADGGHVQALAFAYQYGADLNLLDRERAAACEAAAGRGDVPALLACVTEAGQRRLAMVAQLDAGDLAGFRRSIEAAADLKEDAKPTMLERAALKADAATVGAILERGASPIRTRAFVDGGDPEPARPYAGPLKAQADAQAAASGYADASIPNSNVTPLQSALSRGDADMMRLLARNGAGGTLRWIAVSQGMSGSVPVDMMQESRDVSTLPDRPSAEQMRTLELVIPELARQPDGAEGLEEVFWHAAVFGYDDVLRLTVENGFDPRQAKQPDRIWQAWAGLGNACKPSTGRLLAQYGVDARYPLDPDRNGWLPQKIVAAGCRNPDSAAILVEAGLAPINELDAQGRTVLDEALARPYRPMMQAALRALGGLPGAEVDRSGHERRLAAERQGGDLDLEQSERE